ncbi:unnamed protein product [Prunus brigantina]
MVEVELVFTSTVMRNGNKIVSHKFEALAVKWQLICISLYLNNFLGD